MFECSYATNWVVLLLPKGGEPFSDAVQNTLSKTLSWTGVNQYVLRVLCPVPSDRRFREKTPAVLLGWKTETLHKRATKAVWIAKTNRVSDGFYCAI
jgi:hypothetical protein